jgi:hypothetical protein
LPQTVVIDLPPLQRSAALSFQPMWWYFAYGAMAGLFVGANLGMLALALCFSASDHLGDELRDGRSVRR